MTRIRAFLAGQWPDALLAVIGLAITQVRIIHSDHGWDHAPILLTMLIAVAPALIAIRRIDPLLAGIGLLVGAYLSLLIGELDWVLMAGCGLALWSLSAKCRRAPALVIALVAAGAPLAAALAKSDLVNAVYPRIFQQTTEADGTISTTGGISIEVLDAIYAMNWPWWVSVALAAAAAAGLLYHGTRPVVIRTGGERMDDVRRWLGEARLQRDTVIAMLMTSLVLVDVWRGKSISNWWTAPEWMVYAIAFSALILVLRRKWPVVPVVVLSVASLLAYWQTEYRWTLLGALAIALYTLAADRRLRLSIPVAAVVLAALPVIAAFVRYPQMIIIFPALKSQPFVDFVNDGILHNLTYDELVDRQWPFSLSLILLLAVGAGVLARQYRRNREAAAREAELERRTEAQDEVQVVLTERSNIARDLHDVVAHAVNLMVIQAETGPDLLQRGDRDVLEGFQRIGDTGRRALGELDRLLSALRDADGVPDPQLAPQPGLAELGQLVRDVSHDRLAVELELDGDPDVPPAGHQLTAYRLVQEALTNVARHAEATRAVVAVRISTEGIAVTVTDDGRGFDLAAARKGTRHGLAGMRERVRIHHGTLQIQTSPLAGTVVHAWIPVGAAAKDAPKSAETAKVPGTAEVPGTAADEAAPGSGAEVVR